MKRIILASRYKRVFAKLIDFLILCIFTFGTFFAFVFPNTFDQTSYVNNMKQIGIYYDESGLFLKSSSGTFVSQSSFSNIMKIDDLTSITVKVDDETFKDINLTQSLFNFYTIRYMNFSDNNNLSEEVFKKEILKIGDEKSNIKALDITDQVFTYTMIDDKKESTTVNFVIEVFNSAIDIVNNSEKVEKLSENNRNIMVSALMYFPIILIGFSFILDFLIPLFSRNGQSIGKYIFKLAVLSKDGYTLKKYWLLPRWIGYIFIEIILGVCTIGGMIIISYTMMLFNKKHRVIHDYLGNSVVIDRSNSFWFSSREEEDFLVKRCGVK